MDLDEMIAKATADLEIAEAELLTAQRRVDDLRTIREGMQLAVERYGQTPPPKQDHEPGSPAARQGGGGPARSTGSAARRSRRRPTKRAHTQPNQTDLCLQELEKHGPTSNGEARQRLADQGHPYDPEQIRAAFAYLLRKGKVVRVAPGVWDLPKDDGSGPTANGYRPVTQLRKLP